MHNIILKRYIPFYYESDKAVKSRDKNTLDYDILDPYKVDDFSIDFSQSSFIDMRILAETFRSQNIDHRTFPLLIASSPKVPGSKMISTKEGQEKVNYLATVVLGLISASRELIHETNKKQVSEYISGISNFLTSIISMDRSLEQDPYALSAMIDSAHFMLAEIAPNNYHEFEKRLQELEIEVDGSPVPFKLIKDTDMTMQQEIYVFDSKIGFLVNTITIENIKEIDQDTLYSMDLLYRLTAGGFEYKTEEEVFMKVQKSLAGKIDITSVKMTEKNFDVVNFNENINHDTLIMTSLLDNPLLELFDSDLKTNLFLMKQKNASSLLAQADFRTSLKNTGTYREKISIVQTMSYLMLQLFHEDVQTQRYLDIYTKSWGSWYDKLAKSMNYSLLEVIAGGNSELQDIYYEANRLELFFIQQFNDMNLTAKINELTSTMDYHIFLSNLTGQPMSILAQDLDEQTGAIRSDRLELINHESSYMEYIDPKLIFRVLANKLSLEANYNSFRELHQNLEEILESVQEISQTKQQRIITIAIVIFSITELTLAFLEVFGALFGV